MRYPRMTDKVLCPWCGSEMTVEARGHWSHADDREREWNAWTQCNNEDCGSYGPYALDRPTEEEAINDALKRCLRRYEPPIRPLTLEEVNALDLTNLVWYEDMGGLAVCKFLHNTGSDCYCIYFIGDNTPVIHESTTYGKTWRCWPRKPTDAEREAAGWEDAE